MEQDFHVYEYRMGPESFTFEAHGPREAADYGKYARLHFEERLGQTFTRYELEGPFECSPGRASRAPVSS